MAKQTVPPVTTAPTTTAAPTTKTTTALKATVFEFSFREYQKTLRKVFQVSVEVSVGKINTLIECIRRMDWTFSFTFVEAEAGFEPTILYTRGDYANHYATLSSSSCN